MVLVIQVHCQVRLRAPVGGLFETTARIGAAFYHFVFLSFLAYYYYILYFLVL